MFILHWITEALYKLKNRSIAKPQNLSIVSGFLIINASIMVVQAQEPAHIAVLGEIHNEGNDAIFLPIAMEQSEETVSPPPTPTPTFTSTATPTHTSEATLEPPTPIPPTPTPTFTSTATPTPTLPAPTPHPNVPCLLLYPDKFDIRIGCPPETNGPTQIEWRYYPSGAVSGFDIQLFRDGQVVYHASIDVTPGPLGEIDSYEGTVSGTDFPTFTEKIIHTYTDVGGFLKADVVKTYVDSGIVYIMEVTEICLTGYRVIIFDPPYNGEEIEVGQCAP